MGQHLRVLAIEPYYWHSHRMFLEGYRKYSRHEIEIWDLPARKWKWRMRGSAFHFAERARESSRSYAPDAIIASDFLNLADWKALCPPRFRDVPALLYFHENQLDYPLSDGAPKDFHYGWINLSSALAAEHVLFNSSYQRERFLAEVERVLGRMPDHVPPQLASRLRKKSDVCPVGIDFAPHDEAREGRRAGFGDPPRILWNHRWEYDKDPDAFVDGLIELKRRGTEFRVVICGESFGKPYPAFERARGELAEWIVHLGYFESADEYRREAASCDVVVSTARHEFFGVSVVEAIYLGCLPVLPSRLSYPEIVPPHLHPLFLWDEETPFVDFLERFLHDPPLAYAEEIRKAIEPYGWRRLAPLLDDRMEQIVATGIRDT